MKLIISIDIRYVSDSLHNTIKKANMIQLVFFFKHQNINIIQSVAFKYRNACKRSIFICNRDEYMKMKWRMNRKWTIQQSTVITPKGECLDEASLMLASWLILSMIIKGHDAWWWWWWRDVDDDNHDAWFPLSMSNRSSRTSRVDAKQK